MLKIDPKPSLFNGWRRRN